MDTTETSAGGFATTLRRRRLVARLSQERLAELSGLSARAIRDIERGRVARPRPESVRLIGLALGLAGAELAEFRRLAEEDYWTDREPGPVPRPAVAQLPAAVAGFTGRKDDLDQLDRLLVDPRDPAGGGRIVLVSGAPGVGKTALAVQWAHQAAGWFPAGQLYVDLRGYDPDQPVAAADALAGFLRALGLAGDAIPYDLAERAAAYRTALSGRRLLVVLDNALASDQVRPLLPGSGSCPVLVTSRDSLPGLVARHGAHRLELDLLPEADAVAPGCGPCTTCSAPTPRTGRRPGRASGPPRSAGCWTTTSRSPRPPPTSCTRPSGTGGRRCRRRRARCRRCRTRPRPATGWMPGWPRSPPPPRWPVPPGPTTRSGWPACSTATC